MKFSSYNLNEVIVLALKKLGIIDATPIQDQIIPLAIKGKNIIGISDTGSGKTYSFLIPIFENLNLDNNDLQAVIISPTRELASQLYNVCNELASLISDKIVVKKYIGGTNKSDSSTKCQIAIGTPGRIHDLFINENLLRVDKTKTIVIDEADMVFEDNYIEKIDQIKSKITNDIQYMVFSATISKNLSSFLKKYLKDTKVIDCSSERGINQNISHIMIKSKFDRKDEKLLQLLKTFNPYTCLIFASNKKDVERLYYFLNDNGYKVGMLHGDMQPRQRKRIVKEMLSDKYQYIIASDIASRGLDLKMVTHVISYDLPNEIIFYSHRSGRSGRYDAKGISYILYDENDLAKIAKIKEFGIEFEEYSIIKGELVEKKKHKFKNSNDVKLVITNKDRKVKPGYKKKRKIKLDELRKKARRKKNQKGRR